MIVLTVRIGINGFGRIGRNLLRSVIALEAKSGKPSGIEIVAVNDLVSREVNVHLLRYDSTFGKLDVDVAQTEKGFKVGDREITVFEEKDPKAIAWGSLDIDVVIESTGRFTNREGAAATSRAVRSA